MTAKLKRLKDQVIVITGASSGIGLAAAQQAARRGAAVVLAARSEQTLLALADRMQSNGGRALAVACDVADREQVERLASRALEHFGRIDTWVNNAGLGVYGKAEQCDEADARRLFDVNYWGAVNGCLVALPFLRREGGALITVGSEVSDAWATLLGHYVASKHAIKGFVDVLRVEVEEVEKAPVAITLIQPTAVDTPFPQHARNFLDREPKLPKPMIEAEDVAEAILTAAETPTREKKVGVTATINSLLAKLVPGLVDRAAAGRTKDLMREEPPVNPQGALYRSSEAIGAAGQTKGIGG